MNRNSWLVRRGTAASLALLLVVLAGWQWGPGVLGIPGALARLDHGPGRVAECDGGRLFLSPFGTLCPPLVERVAAVQQR